MAYAKKSFKKRTPYYRRRKAAYRKKRKTYSKVQRVIPSKTMTVCLQYPETILTTSTLVGLLSRFNYTLAGCMNVSLFSTIFDSYKVRKVTWAVRMPFDNINYPGTGSGGTITAYHKAELFTALDWDSPGLQPTTTEEVRAYANRKITIGGSTHSRTFVPKMLTMHRRTSLLNAYTPVKQPFMDLASSDTELSPTVLIAMEPTDGTWSLRADCYSWVTFKDVRKS